MKPATQQPASVVDAIRAAAKIIEDAACDCGEFPNGHHQDGCTGVRKANEIEAAARGAVVQEILIAVLREKSGRCERLMQDVTETEASMSRMQQFNEHAACLRAAVRRCRGDK